MKSKLLDKESDGRRTYMLVFDIGDEVTSLLNFAAEAHLEGSHFAAIGAFQDVVLGWLDLDAKSPTHLRRKMDPRYGIALISTD